MSEYGWKFMIFERIILYPSRIILKLILISSSKRERERQSESKRLKGNGKSSELCAA
jgi:hypothetical protein